MVAFIAGYRASCHVHRVHDLAARRQERASRRGLGSKVSRRP
jgi:hypothetical protein